MNEVEGKFGIQLIWSSMMKDLLAKNLRKWRLALEPWINRDIPKKFFSQERFVWCRNGKDHRNYFNDSINLVNYLDDTNGFLLKAEGLREQESSDPSDGRTLMHVNL